MIAVLDGHQQRGCSLPEYRTGRMTRLAAIIDHTVPEISDAVPQRPVAAIINEGRWLAPCPDCKRGAEPVWLDCPFLLCTYCWNVLLGYHWRLVILPADPAAIVAILGARPFPFQRNWTTETLDELRAENREHGDDEVCH